MCGIVGTASASPTHTRATLIAMRDTMRHRGPDDEGAWWCERASVGFAHRRLSIIDLSTDARQPMVSNSGRSRVVFNGEIYNYRELRLELEKIGRRFRTASDTEVLLEAYEEWGLDCLARLNGMFAFGLYDDRERHLLLARDRAGEKPLFYRHADGGLTFASELKAVLADSRTSRTLDREALEYYLAFGYVPDGLCLIAGIRKLPQAHALLYETESDRLRTFPYWRLPEPEGDTRRKSRTNLDQLAELEHLLADSVRLRLIADVPVGVMLSGGIDSSLVTAMAARVSGTPVRTFTIAFPGHGRFDEAAHAKIVSQHFGTEHVEFAAEPATVELLPELARQFDEPIADSSMVPTYIISKLIRQHATVALGGDGGDELFGGYPHYCWLQDQDRLRSRVPQALLRLVTVAGRHLPLGFRGRNFVLGVGLDVPASIARFNLYFDAEARRRLLALPPVCSNGRSPEAFKMALCPANGSILQQATTVDFQSYLVDDILVKVDRASMLASLEVRAPWLDPRIIEFAFRLPDRLRATRRERKVLPRTLARRVLPAGLDLDRKQGFSLPLDAWFKGDWGRFIQEVLREADAAIFDRRFIDDLLSAQRRGLGNMQRLYALTFFELWRREYDVRVA